MASHDDDDDDDDDVVVVVVDVDVDVDVVVVVVVDDSFGFFCSFSVFFLMFWGDAHVWLDARNMGNTRNY